LCAFVPRWFQRSLAATRALPPLPVLEMPRWASRVAERLAQRVRHSWPSCALVLLVAPVYLSSLPTGLTERNRGADGGELVAAALSGGTAHPPGYPLYCLLLRGASALVPAADPIDVAHHASAVLGLLAGLLVAATTRRCLEPALERSWATDLAALLAGAVYCFGRAAFSQALIAEVYALHGVFVALLIWLTVGAILEPSRVRPGYAAVFGLTCGLAISHHLTAVAVTAVCGLALLLWSGDRLRRPHALAALLASGMLGLLPWLYLPLTAATEPRLSWGTPSSWQQFQWLVTAAQYRYRFGGSLADAFARLASQYSLRQATALVLGLATLAALVVSFSCLPGQKTPRSAQRRVVWLLLALLAVNTLSSMPYAIADLQSYFLPAEACVAVLAGIGCYCVIGALTDVLKRPWLVHATAWSLVTLCVAWSLAYVVASRRRTWPEQAGSAGSRHLAVLAAGRARRRPWRCDGLRALVRAARAEPPRRSGRDQSRASATEMVLDGESPHAAAALAEEARGLTDSATRARDRRQLRATTDRRGPRCGRSARLFAQCARTAHLLRAQLKARAQASESGPLKSRVARAVLLSFLSLSVPQPAVAAPAQGSVVRVLAVGCEHEPSDATRLIELLQVELAQQGISVQAAVTPLTADQTVLAPDELALVTVAAEDCTSNAREVRLEVVDQVTNKRLERRMLIADLAAAERPRALAISIAELLQAAWAETELDRHTEPGLLLPQKAREQLMRRLAVRPPAPSAPPQDSPPQATQPVKRGPPRRWSLELGALARAFPSAGMAWLGGDASARYRLASPVAVRQGVELTTGGGSMPTRSANGGVLNVTGETVLGHLSVSLITDGATQLEIGPRLSVGYTHLTGNARENSGALVIYGVEGELRFAISSRWGLGLGADIGRTLAGVSVEELGTELSAALGNVGVTTGLRFGVAFRP
jgi:hypothetical protein